MDWIEITIETTSEGADIAAQVLYDAGVTGVVIEDPNSIRQIQQEESSWDYIDESILEDMEEKVYIKAYLNNDEYFEEKLSQIKDKLIYLKNQNLGLDLGTLDVKLSSVKEEDWANNWKQYYKPFKASERIVIKPSWEEYSKRAMRLYWRWILGWLLAPVPTRQPLFAFKLLKSM